MKIVICGSQSVGKTTLVSATPEKYKDIIVRELIRDVVKNSTECMNYNEDSDAHSQIEFFKAYWEQLSKMKNYVSDRGLLDVCAYTKHLMYQRKIGKGIYDMQLKNLKSWIETHPDEVYIYIPIEFDITDDGFRSLDKEYQKGCDECIKEVLDECGIKYHTIKGKHEKRVVEFLKIIEQEENRSETEPKKMENDEKSKRGRRKK